MSIHITSNAMVTTRNAAIHAQMYPSYIRLCKVRNGPPLIKANKSTSPGAILNAIHV